MRSANHSPAYVLQIQKRWRVVVPIRGKLTPRLWAEAFSTRAAAEEWLRSEEGINSVLAMRGSILGTHRALKMA